MKIPILKPKEATHYLRHLRTSGIPPSSSSRACMIPDLMGSPRSGENCKKQRQHQEHSNCWKTKSGPPPASLCAWVLCRIGDGRLCASGEEALASEMQICFHMGVLLRTTCMFNTNQMLGKIRSSIANQYEA